MEIQLRYLSILSALAPIITRLFIKKLTNEQKLIYILIWISFSSDCLSFAFAYIFRNSYYVIQLYIILEILIISQYFKLLLKSKIPIAFGSCLVLTHFAAILMYGITTVDPVLRTVEMLFFLALAFSFFYDLFKNQNQIFFEKLPEFWFNIGFLFYFSGSLFSWILFQYINSSDLALTWSFHNIANILKNILFTIGLWKVRPTT